MKKNFYKKPKISKNTNLNSNISKNSLLIRSMVISAMLLSLYIIFAYIGNQFFRLAFLASFLNLDISLIFLIPLVFICSARYWIFVGVVGGLANFLWQGTGGWVGSVYNVVLNLILLSFVHLLKFIFIDLAIKLRSKKTLRDKEAIDYKFSNKDFSVRIFLICLISFIFMILINSLLNGLLFTPLYISQYSKEPPNFIEIQKKPNVFIAYTLGITNYWAGIFALYSAFNAIKFGIVFSVVFPVLTLLLIKSNIVQNYFGQPKYVQKQNVSNEYINQD